MYRTKAAFTYVDNLHIQESNYMAHLAKATEPYDRGLWQGYIAQTRLLREFAEQWLEQVEAEAELVPTPSAEMWMEENQLAGDLRDFSRMRAPRRKRLAVWAYRSPRERLPRSVYALRREVRHEQKLAMQAYLNPHYPSKEWLRVWPRLQADGVKIVMGVPIWQARIERDA